MDEREKYFEYVTGVLGIKSILLEAGSAVETIPLLLLVEGLSGYSAAEEELLSKMIAALKMYRLADLQQGGGIQRSYTVEFLDQTKVASSENVQQVYSARTLVKNPVLKKQAWEDLQKVTRHFSA